MLPQGLGCSEGCWVATGLGTGICYYLPQGNEAGPKFSLTADRSHLSPIRIPSRPGAVFVPGKWVSLLCGEKAVVLKHVQGPQLQCRHHCGGRKSEYVSLLQGRVLAFCVRHWLI